MYITDCAVARCLSICLSHAGIMLKALNISSNFCHCRVAIVFFHTKCNSDRGPLVGASNAGNMKKILIIDHYFHLGNDTS